MSKSPKTITGISGLDELLNGGLPSGRVILLVGEPGAGKTVLAAQFLVNGIEKFNENGLFVSLDESRYFFNREMSGFGWDFEEFEKNKKFTFLDASPIRHIPGSVKLGQLTIGKRDFSLVSLIEAIRSNAKAMGTRRIVVDSISSFIFQFPDASERRTAILDLIEALAQTQATCMITTELRTSGLKRMIQVEEYLAHGVILMQTLQVGRTLVRAIQLEKMRETLIDRQPRPYKITNNGIEVYPKESVF